MTTYFNAMFNEIFAIQRERERERKTKKIFNAFMIQYNSENRVKEKL